MAVTQLASSTDVAAVLGRALTSEETAKVGAVLDKASELFRHRSGQTFTVATSTVRIRNRAGVVTLMQSPVTAVTAVVDEDGGAIEFTYVRGQQFIVSSTNKYVTVTYSHGSATVPDLVRLTIAEIAKKVLLISDSAAAGMSSHMRTTGPFTDQESYAAWAVGGQTMLSPSDDMIALSYRIPMAGPIHNT